jgi:trk system potassium uptake protein TrkA
MKILIVGGGKTVYFLCRNLAAKGYEVVIINHDREECVRLARQLKATIVYGDGSDARILEEAGVMSAFAVLAVTPRDQDNLVICQLASLQYRVPRTLALANDPDNAELFEQLGVSAFSTTHIIGSLIEERASFDQITCLLPIGAGRVNITEIVLDKASPVVGQVLKDIALPENSLVAVVIRDDHAIVPRGGNELMADDRLVLITMPENHGPVMKVFTGEKK